MWAGYRRWRVAVKPRSGPILQPMICATGKFESKEFIISRMEKEKEQVCRGTLGPHLHPTGSWYTSSILVPGKLRQEEHMRKASLGYIERHWGGGEEWRRRIGGREREDGERRSKRDRDRETEIELVLHIFPRVEKSLGTLTRAFNTKCLMHFPKTEAMLDTA